MYLDVVRKGKRNIYFAVNDKLKLQDPKQSRIQYQPSSAVSLFVPTLFRMAILTFHKLTVPGITFCQM
jgi:hypothetical protein